MNIREIHENKKQFLSLLLLADEQEDMIDRYLEKGEMYVLLASGQAVAEAVVLQTGADECELMNLAADPAQRGKGYATKLVNHLLKLYQPRCRRMRVGTSPAGVGFYERFGFQKVGLREGFFSENYESIEENGKPLTDMIVMEREL